MVENINVTENHYHYIVKYTLLLVRYGELALKSNYTRRKFEQILKKNISIALDKENIPHKIRGDRGRIYVKTNYIKKSIPVLKKIFGVTSFSPVYTTDAEIPAVSHLVTHLAKKLLTAEKSFALRVSRTGTHDFSSQDIANQVGRNVCENTHAQVNLTSPDVEIFIEIRDNHAYVFTEKIPGPGGLPLGTQGSVLVIVDSPQSLLAAWYLMKRGCNVVFFTDNTSKEDLIKNFTQQWYTPTLIFSSKGKRFFTKEINTIISTTHCNAVVTGNMLIENPKKTIDNIQQLKSRIKHPLLHPLIAMEKNEVYKKCKELGVPL